MAEVKIGSIKRPEEPKLIYDEQYKHSIVSSSYTPHTSLLSNLEGTPVFTEYYRQIRGGDEETIGLQPDSLPVYQSYTKIKGLIIKFENKESFSFDAQTGTSTARGVGYVLFDLVPMKSDLFIMDIGDGQAGLFQVDEAVEYKTLNIDKAYQIEFKMIAIVDQAIENNLNAKVVKTLIYSKESAINGGNAVLTTTDYDDNRKLTKLSSLITEHVMSNFYWKREKTIILPIENKIIYDPYLTKFLYYTLPTKKLGMRENINVLNVSYATSDMGQEKLTVWDMFLRKNFDTPKQFQRDYFLHDKRNLLQTRFYGNVYFSDVDEVITYHKYGAPSKAYNVISNSIILEDPPQNNGNKEGTAYDYYFSKEFYEGQGTDIEKMVWKFFKEKTLDKQALIKLMEEYFELSPMDQLYMSGIYIGAAKIALITTYEYL